MYTNTIRRPHIVIAYVPVDGTPCQRGNNTCVARNRTARARGISLLTNRTRLALAPWTHSCPVVRSAAQSHDGTSVQAQVQGGTGQPGPRDALGGWTRFGQLAHRSPAAVFFAARTARGRRPSRACTYAADASTQRIGTGWAPLLYGWILVLGNWHDAGATAGAGPAVHDHVLSVASVRRVVNAVWIRWNWM
jgi:hypothetical protein